MHHVNITFLKYIHLKKITQNKTKQNLTKTKKKNIKRPKKPKFLLNHIIYPPNKLSDNYRPIIKTNPSKVFQFQFIIFRSNLMRLWNLLSWKHKTIKQLNIYTNSKPNTSRTKAHILHILAPTHTNHSKQNNNNNKNFYPIKDQSDYNRFLYLLLLQRSVRLCVYVYIYVYIYMSGGHKSQPNDGERKVSSFK